MMRKISRTERPNKPAAARRPAVGAGDPAKHPPDPEPWRPLTDKAATPFAGHGGRSGCRAGRRPAFRARATTCATEPGRQVVPPPAVRLDAVAPSTRLREALLHRARLDAARRQAAADGALIDPWHLAAVLEGLPLRAMRDSARVIDAGALLDAAWGAWRWIEHGGARPPLRAALVRRWAAAGLLRAPLPFTGAAALGPG